MVFVLGDALSSYVRFEHAGLIVFVVVDGCEQTHLGAGLDRGVGNLFDVVTWMWGYLDTLQTRLALKRPVHRYNPRMTASSFVTRTRNRAALTAVMLAVAALAVGAASASANSFQWGDNGSGACNNWQTYQSPSLAGTEIGTYCMQ